MRQGSGKTPILEQTKHIVEWRHLDGVVLSFESRTKILICKQTMPDVALETQS